jgi:hypothetical protein
MGLNIFQLLSSHEKMLKRNESRVISQRVLEVVEADVHLDAVIAHVSVPASFGGLPS